LGNALLANLGRWYLIICMLTYSSIEEQVASRRKGMRVLILAMLVNTLGNGAFLWVNLRDVENISEPLSRLTQALGLHPLFIASYIAIYLKLRAKLGREETLRTAWFFTFLCQYLVLQSVNQTVMSYSESDPIQNNLDRVSDILECILYASSMLEFFGISRMM